MTMFKVKRGLEESLPLTLSNGTLYFCTDTGNIYIDIGNARKQISAEYAKGLKKDDTIIELDDIVLKDTFDTAISTLTINYNESIIALSVNGRTVTYVKGDGSTHTFETQDNDTTYSLGTDEVTGLTKLYATTGNAEDGTMTQKAIKTELDKKVGVNIDNTNHTLIFTI